MFKVLSSLDQGREGRKLGVGGGGWGLQIGHNWTDSTVRAQGGGSPPEYDLLHLWTCFPGCSKVPTPERGFQVHLEGQVTQTVGILLQRRVIILLGQVGDS